MRQCRLIFMSALLVGILAGLVACGGPEQKKKSSRGEDLEYTVVPTADIPADFAKEIEEKKINAFQMTYDDGAYLYAAVGYGEQASGGFSIQVLGLYENGENLCLETSLTGPEEDEVVSDKASFPYIVLKMKRTEKEMEFDT